MKIGINITSIMDNIDTNYSLDESNESKYLIDLNLVCFLVGKGLYVYEISRHSVHAYYSFNEIPFD